MVKDAGTGEVWVVDALDSIGRRIGRGVSVVLRVNDFLVAVGALWVADLGLTPWHGRSQVVGDPNQIEDNSAGPTSAVSAPKGIRRTTRRPL